MKKSLLLFAAALLSLTACKKDALTSLADITFTKSYTEDIDVPGGIADTNVTVLGGSQDLPFSFSLATGIQQLVSQYNTSTDKLVSVKVDSVSFTAIAPVGQNLDFLNSVELRLNANGLTETTIARKSVFPKGQTTVQLDVLDVNLKDFFLKDSLTVRVVANVNALPANGTKLRFGNKYAITANPLR